MTAPPQAPAPPPLLGSEPDATLIWQRVRKRPVPLISVAFTVPVFLAYHLGILVLDRRSQVDFISSALMRLSEASERTYVLLTLALALALLLFTWVQQKRGKIPESPHKRVFWESLGGAALGLVLLGWLSHRVLPIEQTASVPLSVLDKLVLSTGAAFHEELVFRAGLIYGGSWLLVKMTKLRRPWLVLGLSVLLSCLLYALSHYFVIFDEPFTWTAAGFRVVEGLFFAAVFVLRGFAVAVYAHLFYNLVTSLLYF